MINVTGIVKQGHQVASGIASDSPYDQGTIKIQLPFFQKLGLDLSPYYLGTLNISIAPHSFAIKQPQYTFKKVKWHPDYPPEDFSFSPCQVIVENINYSGFIYYPHPETKIGHFQDDSILEAIALPIPNLNYGDSLQLVVDKREIIIY
ncbi:MAG: hypothetical protein WA865_15425 [Spirulinaceae cyanobacterium]